MTMPGGFILDELRVRNAIADAGQSSVGLGSTGPLERQDRYSEWLFPAQEDARSRAAMADAMYSCGLNALACLRASGVDAPELSQPYSTHIGAALAWLGSIARRMGAYVDLSTPAAVAKAPPLRWGDILVVDGPVHVIVLTGENEDGVTFTTSEGGSPEYGRTRDGKGMERGMGIKTRTMRTRVFGGRLQTGTVNADGSVTWGRLALYAISAKHLLTREGRSDVAQG